MILKAYSAYSKYFEENSHEIWGLPTILKVTLIYFFACFALFFSNALHLDAENLSGWETLFVAAFVIMALWWSIFIPLLLLQLFWRYTKRTFFASVKTLKWIRKFSEKNLTRENITDYYSFYYFIYKIKFLKLKNNLEYNVANFFDPMPEEKRNENVLKYLKRIDAKYALRYTSFLRYAWFLAAFSANCTNLSAYHPKDRKIMKKFIDETNRFANEWDTLYREANWRYYDEVLK